MTVTPVSSVLIKFSDGSSRLILVQEEGTGIYKNEIFKGTNTGFEEHIVTIINGKVRDTPPFEVGGFT